MKTAGTITLHNVIAAIINGITTPNTGIIFLKPRSFMNPFVHVIKTKVFTQICNKPANKPDWTIAGLYTTPKYSNTKGLAIKKSERPQTPEITIQILDFLRVLFILIN